MGDKQYNPRDRIKNHLKRKSSCRSLNFTEKPAINFENLEEPDAQSCPAPTNPFKISSPQKKRRPCQVTFSEDAEENAQDPFSASVLRHQEAPKTPTNATRTSPRKKKGPQFERFQSFDPTLLQEFHAVDFSQLISTSSSSASQKNAEPSQESAAEVPSDLRIGGKMRISSKIAFQWMSSRKSTGIVGVRIPAVDRYLGLKYFNNLYATGAENPTIEPPVSPLSLLEASTLYYQFPVIPGMSLYPRITSELGSVTRIPLAAPATAKMSDQWVECFEQLFMSYKKGERDAFYVATAVFNVLFTKTTVSDEMDQNNDESQSCHKSFFGQKMVALVSHTSSAIREHLRAQGVDYETVTSGKSTNLRRSSSSFVLNNTTNTSTLDGLENSEKSMNPPENDEDYRGESSDENDSPTKANSQWLKNIGVSPRQIKGTARRQLSSQISDREGISCVLVKGNAVQSLYNLLMSSEIVHEKTGPYTKIPPTLIGTAPFLYGQLLALNKTSQIISKSSTKSSEYILELSGGPILPHCAKMISQFVRSAHLTDKENEVSMQVSDRFSCQGMSDWTARTTNWNTVTVGEDAVKWTKN